MEPVEKNSRKEINAVVLGFTLQGKHNFVDQHYNSLEVFY
jgi:hypothetical protein